MMHLKEGSLLQGGKYRIVRFINSGGFGCTYEAEHVMFRKRVAVKEFFVKDFCNRDEETAFVTVGTTSKKGLISKLKQKFIDEARSIFEFHHPGIVRVTDVFEENGTAYYVMDYIEGKSLKEIVDEEGALSESRALGYIRQVADALEYVHAHNRLHLDIKPGNIMIDSNGHAVLIDFGTSKQYDEVNGENTSTLLGHTAGYAPPEQVGNDLVKFTPATDIYALGATLYKLLSGITPISSTLRNSGDKLASLPKSISASTCKAVDKAMKLNRHDRIQSIENFKSLMNEKMKRTLKSRELLLGGFIALAASVIITVSCTFIASVNNANPTALVGVIFVTYALSLIFFYLKRKFIRGWFVIYSLFSIVLSLIYCFLTYENQEYECGYLHVGSRLYNRVGLCIIKSPSNDIYFSGSKRKLSYPKEEDVIIGIEINREYHAGNMEDWDIKFKYYSMDYRIIGERDFHLDSIDCRYFIFLYSKEFEDMKNYIERYDDVFISREITNHSYLF